MPLAPKPAGDRAQLHDAAQKFEAIMVRQMLASARSGGVGDQLFGSQAAETFNSMRDERFADIASRTGALGFARVIETQLAKQAGIAPAAGATASGGAK